MYSYLLVEKKFSFESMPSAPTKEKRFAYSLYLDTLVLFYRISRMISRRGGAMPLADTRFIKRLASDDILRNRQALYTGNAFPLEAAAESIAARLKESSYYKNLVKRLDEGAIGAEESIWREIFNIFVLPDPVYKEAVARRENYTLKGEERMKAMMEETFSNFLASQDDGREAERMLGESLDKARELYFRLLLLPVELTYMQLRKIEENRLKFLATEEDLNPNMRFVDNSLVEMIRDCEAFKTYIDRNDISWLPEDRDMMESLLTSITSSEIYMDYMEAPSTDKARDCEFWRNVFRKIIMTNEDFLQTLEDTSVFWNDDYEIMATFVVKTFKRFEEGESHPLLEKFKDEEDARFGFELLKDVLRNRDVYRGYIDSVLREHKWDRDRLAFMDVLIVVTALAEILNFPKIPLTVSINEYIEIAKSYSSAKSGSFVNGLLGSVIKMLKEEGILHK